jgi:hypothetical protein
MNYRLGRFLKIPVRKAISGPIVFVDFPPAPNLTCAACVGHRLSNRPSSQGISASESKGSSLMHFVGKSTRDVL